MSVRIVAASPMSCSLAWSLSRTAMALPSSEVVVSEFVSVTTMSDMTNEPKRQTQKAMNLPR